jgi:hypothetical protein
MYIHHPFVDCSWFVEGFSMGSCASTAALSHFSSSASAS